MTEQVRLQAETYGHLFQCIPRNSASIFGNFNSEDAKILTIALRKKCSGIDDCSDKSDFKGGYLILLSNRIRFDNKLFGEETIVKEVEIHWLEV